MSEPRIGDQFTAEKFRWLDQVLADTRREGAAFEVAYLLATRYLNRQSGTAWPSIPTLASALNKSVRRTQDAITSLVNRGHLTCKRGGQGHANVYTIALHDVTKTSDQTELAVDENVLSNEAMTGRKRPINEIQTGHFRSNDRTISSKMTGRKRPPNPIKEPYEEPIESFGSEIDFNAIRRDWDKLKMSMGCEKYFEAKKQIIATHFPELLKQIETYPDGITRLCQLDPLQQMKASALLALKGRDAAKQFVFSCTY